MPDSIHVFTFKKGLLSRVAHDLRLSVHRWAITPEGDGFVASFEVMSLQVDGVMKRGQLDGRTLSAKDCRDVLDNTHKQVLKSRRHPRIVYRGQAERSGDTLRVTGKLDMVGRQVPQPFVLRIEGDRAVGQVELRPTRWGIQPFTALMGAMAVEDRVVVAFDMAIPEDLRTA
jgi:hypothetical protein